MKPANTKDHEPEIPPEGGHGFDTTITIAIVAMIALAIVAGLLFT